METESRHGENQPINLVMPELKFHYHPALIYRVYWYWQRSNSATPPSLEEVAAIDLDLDADLRMMESWIQYQRDYLKRPDFLKL